MCVAYDANGTAIDGQALWDKNYTSPALFMNVLTVSKKPSVDTATWASENSHVDLAHTT